MLRVTTMLAVAGMIVHSAQPVFADCADGSGTPTQQVQSGIAKDGSHAPMETKAPAQTQPGPAEGTTTASSDTAAEVPQKDGANMPMGENPDVATSSQDAQAQQKGGKTAAGAANAHKC